MELPTQYKNLNTKQKRSIRNRYIGIQKGLCYYCKKPLIGEPPPKVKSKPLDLTKFPKYFFNYPIHLHHDHKTGMTLGVVHNYCNAVLWQYHGE